MKTKWNLSQLMVFMVVFCFMLVLSTLMAVPARAGYFCMIDPAHPQINGGFDIHGDVTKPTTMLAMVTHSPKDGYFLIPGVNWTPLAVGGGFTPGGSFHVAAGPSLNLLPVVQNILGAVVDGITPADKYLNLKSILKTGETDSGDIVGSLGINLEYDFTGKALTVPLFAGIQWTF